MSEAKVDYCNPPPHVVTYPTLAVVMVAFVSLAGGFGAFAYGQARDAGAASVEAAKYAGEAGVEAAKRVDDRVTALTLVVAENQLAAARATSEIQSDLRALSLQMVTGKQPEQLKPKSDGGQ